MEIREFENGQFQVWHDGEILDPKNLKLQPDWLAHNSWMYFRTISDAKLAAADYMAKINVVKIHSVE